MWDTLELALLHTGMDWSLSHSCGTSSCQNRSNTNMGHIGVGIASYWHGLEFVT